MDNVFQRKYKLATAILADVADCAGGRLVLVGGTALALFYLQHRVSVDLDFVPLSGDAGEAAASPTSSNAAAFADETKHKEALKGCLSKKGYRTQRARFSNQFIVQSEATSIKVEVFTPDEPVKKIEKRIIGGGEVNVASLDDLLEMKTSTYARRKKARDLFDVVAILLHSGKSMAMAEGLVKKHGVPQDAEELSQMSPDEKALAAFHKVIGK